MSKPLSTLALGVLPLAAAAAARTGRDLPHLQQPPERPSFPNGGWLQVDLRESPRVTRGLPREKLRPLRRPVRNWTIECADCEAGPWREVAAGTTVGASPAVDSPPRTEVRYLRLNVSAAGRPALSEFQIF